MEQSQSRLRAGRPMKIEALQTRIFHPRESLADFIVERLTGMPLENGLVLAVTSKIMSLAEGRLVGKTEIDKAALVRRESDVYMGEIGYGCHLTVKHGLFIPSAGIDESNSENGDYILYPKDPFASARELWVQLRRAWNLQELGIVITDSHTTPLRKGVTGISLAHWGFKGLNDLIGHADLFGKPLQVTTVNLADGLAAAATLLMGEADECAPLALIHNAPVEFRDEIDPAEVKIPLEQDLYFPLLEPLLAAKTESRPPNDAMR